MQTFARAHATCVSCSAGEELSGGKWWKERWKELRLSSIRILARVSVGASDCQDLQDELHRKFNVADFLECASSSEVLQK